MIKKEKGITLVVLIITVVVMLIIVSTTIFLSMDRFEVNDVREMYSDLQLLEDEVSNYYLKYGKLPILRNSENEAIKYTYTSLNFKIDSRDNANYYILDLASMGNLSLNYGQEGFKKVNTDDIYIINEASNTIYYVRGIENGGLRYHYIKKETSVLEDNIPPTKPEIKVVSGFEKSPGFYTTEVEIEIIPGKDSLSDVWYTTYSVDGKAQEYKGKIKLSQGKHTITAKTYDINNISSAEASLMLEVHVEHSYDDGIIKEPSTCLKEGIKYFACTNEKCVAFYEDALAKTKHDYEDIIKLQPTCTEDGIKQQICKNCKYEGGISIVSALGHNLRYVNGEDATCFGAGYENYKCGRCSYEEIKILDKRSHYFVDCTPVEDSYVCPHVHKLGYRCGYCNQIILRYEGHWFKNLGYIGEQQMNCMCGAKIWIGNGFSYYPVECSDDFYDKADEDYWRYYIGRQDLDKKRFGSVG